MIANANASGLLQNVKDFAAADTTITGTLGETTGYWHPVPSSRCPHCGYCPHCGRSNGWPTFPVYGNNPQITYTCTTSPVALN